MFCFEDFVFRGQVVVVVFDVDEVEESVEESSSPGDWSAEVIVVVLMALPLLTDVVEFLFQEVHSWI